MGEAFLGLGGNMGDRAGHLRAAVEALREADGIERIEVSSLYRTKPVGREDQEWFLNAAAHIETSLAARELLGLCLQIEVANGRIREERWGPRTLDLDILLYGDERIEELGLIVPHPRLCERAFALAPLLELDRTLAAAGEPLVLALERIGTTGVERLLSFEQSERVAVLGASERPERYAYQATGLLMERGHSVLPISPKASSAFGVPFIPSLAGIAREIATLTVYVRPDRFMNMIDEVIQAHPKRVIFNPGAELKFKDYALLRREGIEAEEACTLVLLRTEQF